MLRILLIIGMFIVAGSIWAQESFSSYTVELEQVEATSEATLQMVTADIQKNLRETGYILAPQPKETAFIFSIPDTVIDFTGIISAGEKTDSTLLRVNSADTYGYELLASLKQPFTSALGETIPQTQCDKKTPCFPASPNKWTGKNTYGWGFRLSGPGAVLPFPDDTFFGIFDEMKQTVLTRHEGESGESSAKLTFKVRIPPEQKEGNYTGVIKIIAVPIL